MKGLDLSKMSPEVLRLNRLTLDDAHVTRKMLPEDFVETKEVLKQEKDLQKLCEQELNRRGYHRLVGDAIGTTPPCGYYGHIPGKRAKASMFLLDLLILGPGGRFLMVELKTNKRYQPGQRELVEQGYGVMCYSFEEFVDELTKWETEREERNY